MKRGVVTFEGMNAFVDIAETSTQQALGLRKVPSLAWNQGMLFVADAPREWLMTMYGVLIPLRIFYLDSDHVVTWIDVAPVGWIGFKPRVAKYVLETNEDWGYPVHVGSRAGIWVER